MQEKHIASVFLEIFVVVVVLGLLLALAIPHVGQLLDKSKDVSPDTEYKNIPTAVPGVPSENKTGTLVPVGPTVNISEMPPGDTPP